MPLVGYNVPNHPSLLGLHLLLRSCRHNWLLSADGQPQASGGLRVGCRCRHGCLSLHYLCPFYHSSHYPPISLLVICPYLSITVVLFFASALFLLLARQWQDDEPYRLRYVRLLVYCYTVVVAGWEGGMVCTTMICTQYGLWRLGAVVVLLSLSQRCLIVAANPWVIKFSLNMRLVIYHGIFC